MANKPWVSHTNSAKSGFEKPLGVAYPRVGLFSIGSHEYEVNVLAMKEKISKNNFKNNSQFSGIKNN